MANTPNYNLNKPLAGTKNYDVLLNQNFDIIDEEIKNRVNEIGVLSTLNTTNKTDLVSAINENVSQLAEIANAATIVIAASDSSDNMKKHANFVCDGVDDQVEINAAITMLTANGGKILLSDGTFNISASIEIQRSFVTLEGQNFGEASIVYDQEGFGTKLKGATGVNIVEIYAPSTASYRNRGIQIKNLQISGEARTDTSIGLHVWMNNPNLPASTDYLMISQIAVINCGTGIQLNNTDTTTITNSWVSECGESIIANSCAYTQINNCCIADCDSNGIIMLSAYSFLITHNIFARNTTSITVTSNSHDGNISGNIIEGAKSDSIYVDSSEGIIVSDNNISDGINGAGVAMGNGSNYGNIHHNKIKNCKYGIAIFGSIDNNFVNINNNTIYNNAQEGIYLSYLLNSKINENICYGNGKSENNMYDNIKLSGDSSNNSLHGNICRKGTNANLPAYGIDVSASTCNNNTIGENDISDGGIVGDFRDLGTGTYKTVKYTFQIPSNTTISAYNFWTTYTGITNIAVNSTVKVGHNLPSGLIVDARVNIGIVAIMVHNPTNADITLSQAYNIYCTVETSK